MIFAADLDRTLIYSARRLDPLGPGVVPVEWRGREPYGFMTARALRAFQGLASRTAFFVNTMRGLEQAQRVGFVASGWCRYLALQNGLYLRRDGKEDAGWSDYVRRTVEDLPLSLSDAAARVLGQLPGVQCLSKQYTYMAVFFVKDTFDDQMCAALAAELASSGWALHRQRKKLYLSPLALHKGAVLQHVRELEQDDLVWGFGDSYFDIPMLRLCQRAWAPKESELWYERPDFFIAFSRAPAQAGTQEILEQALRELP